MRELQLSEVKIYIAHKDTFGLYFYTPLCGTCKLGARMLEIAMHTDPSIPVFQANINVMPELAQEMQISSIPSLLLIKSGEIIERVHAMRSVDYLYEKLLLLKS